MALTESLGLFEYLLPVFLFIFFFAFGYGLLLKTKFFGDNKGLLATIAFIMALLVVLMPQARLVVSLFTPWVALLGMLVVLILVMFMFLGVKEDAIVKETVGHPLFITFVAAAIIILFLVALSQAYGNFLLVNNQPGFWNDTKRLLFAPRILGAIFILVVSGYMIRYLTTNK